MVVAPGSVVGPSWLVLYHPWEQGRSLLPGLSLRPGETELNAGVAG
jgi:hypothetical protein